MISKPVDNCFVSNANHIIDYTLQIARDGRMDSLNTFLERCDHGSRERRQLDALDKDGFAALHYAARFNRVAITEKLLEAKCGKIETNHETH